MDNNQLQIDMDTRVKLQTSPSPKQLFDYAERGQYQTGTAKPGEPELYRHDGDAEC